jgi:hypothetical protein
MKRSKSCVTTDLLSQCRLHSSLALPGLALLYGKMPPKNTGVRGSLELVAILFRAVAEHYEPT